MKRWAESFEPQKNQLFIPCIKNKRTKRTRRKKYKRINHVLYIYIYIYSFYFLEKSVSIRSRRKPIIKETFSFIIIIFNCTNHSEDHRGTNLSCRR